MLCSALHTRFSSRVSSVTVTSLPGLQWGCRSARGGEAVLSTDEKAAAITPPDALMIALGACAADSLKFLLEKHGAAVARVDADVEGDWEVAPRRRLSAFRLTLRVDADRAPQELLDRLTARVERDMCTVCQTLQTPPAVAAAPLK